MRKSHLIVSACLVVACACGGKKKQNEAGKQPSSATNLGSEPPTTPKVGKNNPAATPLTPKPMGFDKVYHINYRLGRGASAYAKARHAMRIAAKRPAKADAMWKTVENRAGAAVAADPRHLAAQFALALAMARRGVTTGVAEHLSIALAGDWLRFGPTLETRSELAKYLDTPQGKAVVALNKTYKEQFARKATAGVLLLGRRSKFREPRKPGKQWSASRGELFAYDIQTKRYLRLTHTKETVVAWLMSPSGDEIAYVAHNLVVWPKKSEDPPLLNHITIGIINAETFLRQGKRVHIYKPLHGVRLQYRTGDELVIAGLSTMGRYKAGAPRYFIYDKAEGKLRKLKTPPGAGYPLDVTYEWVAQSKKPADHIQAERESSTFRLLRTQQTITLPEGELVSNTAFVWSPDGAHLAFHTMAKPCEGQPESTLYVVEAATGKLKNLLRGHSEFGMKWIDNNQLIYEDTDDNLRVYDVAQQKQTHKLRNRPGLSLTGLPSKKGPLCKQDNVATPDNVTTPRTKPTKPASPPTKN